MKVIVLNFKTTIHPVLINFIVKQMKVNLNSIMFRPLSYAKAALQTVNLAIMARLV